MFGAYIERETVAELLVQPTPFAQLVGWGVGDFLFDHEADNITSTVKVRQADFGDALDAETRLPELFDELVEQKVLPPMRSHR